MDCESDNDMPEKIIKHLLTIIKEDNLLCEFSLIPTSLENIDKNVSPVKYSIPDHCVGLETWCVKHVFKYAQQQIFKYHKQSKLDVIQLNGYLSIALLIQPDVTTFWNIKRQLVLSKNDISVEDELKISRLILSFKKKSLEAFTFRTWLIHQLQSTELVDHQKLLRREFAVLEMATCNSLNNYHAWNHRIWCYENLLLKHLPKSLQVDELSFTESWIKQHVSEHTGFHYRQYVLGNFKKQVLLTEDVLSSITVFNDNIINSMLDSEYLDKFDENDVYVYNQFISLLIWELFKVLPTLHYGFPGHESIWYHRRYIMYNIYQTVCEIYGLTCKNVSVLKVPQLPFDVNVVDSSVEVAAVCSKNYRFLAVESSNLFKSLMVKERIFLNDVVCKNSWNCEDVELERRYGKWLKCILGVNI